MAWYRRFETPIKLPDGRRLVTLDDAAAYIQLLPKKEQDLPHWQTAIRELLICADRGGIMFLAELGMMQALHYGEVVEKEPRRKRVKKYKVI